MMRRVLKFFLWGAATVIAAYVILVIARIPHAYDKQRTEEQVAKIHATKLTLDDVMGKNLPPDPGIDADKTIQGIDANHNNIRDDVELAIFREYPNSARTRAVLLQYALALQMEVVQTIVNTNTATEVVTEQGRSGICLTDTLVPRKSPESSRSDADMQKIDVFIHFIKNKQFNTDARKTAREDFLGEVKFLGDSTNEVCDIDPSVLPD